MERPVFPKRAVITGGMPYGNKTLHFGHVGGMFVHADVFARFLRDRIGKDNVVFVSGTDCYGSPIAEGYRKKVESEGYEGTIEDYVMENHNNQLKTLNDYKISLDLFGASGLEDTKEVHQEETDEFIRTLYKNGWLEKLVTKQFYDPKYHCFLNGRQVVGKCPIENCQSEKGYADECDLGHQYMPEELIDPKSTLSGETPEMRDVTNWYFKLTVFNDLLKEYVDDIKTKKNVRRIVVETMEESLGAPVIYIQEKFLDQYKTIEKDLPDHENSDLENIKGSFTVTFDKLEKREKACPILSNAGIRYRTGKTLVPLRLTGNIEWGVKAPKLEDEEDAIITDNDRVVKTLKALCKLMDDRYLLLKKAHVRNIKEYNELFKARKLNPLEGHNFMPYYVVIIDEFGDLIMTAGKEVELPICRIAQLARAIGIHMIIATQRPVTTIITGTIKANFPARIAFKVTSGIDSKIILDRSGANQLIGKGDMLYLGNAEPVRVQCAFVDTPEVKNICKFISEQQQFPEMTYLPDPPSEDGDGTAGKDVDMNHLDSMFAEVARMVVGTGAGSTSAIQRKFSIGYNRAGRLMDQLEKAGIVGPQQGSKPREVLISDLLTLDSILISLGINS